MRGTKRVGLSQHSGQDTSSREAPPIGMDPIQLTSLSNPRSQLRDSKFSFFVLREPRDV